MPAWLHFECPLPLEELIEVDPFEMLHDQIRQPTLELTNIHHANDVLTA